MLQEANVTYANKYEERWKTLQKRINWLRKKHPSSSLSINRSTLSGRFCPKFSLWSIRFRLLQISLYQRQVKVGKNEKSQAVQLIQELSNANGVSGFETEVVRILQHATADFTIQRLDSIKNLYLEKKNNLSEGPVVLLMLIVTKWVL